MDWFRRGSKDEVGKSNADTETGITSKTEGQADSISARISDVFGKKNVSQMDVNQLAQLINFRTDDLVKYLIKYTSSYMIVNDIVYSRVEHSNVDPVCAR
jgi:hypothetical protein